MKAKARRQKKIQEQSSQNIENSESTKKKITSISPSPPPPNNQDNIIENKPPSVPANNINTSKISKRVLERRNKKNKNFKEIEKPIIINNPVQKQSNKKIVFNVEPQAPVVTQKKEQFKLIRKNDPKYYVLKNKGNYKLLLKNYGKIKMENIDDFLSKTTPKKLNDDEKNEEIENMVRVMNLDNEYVDINDYNVANEAHKKIISDITKNIQITSENYNLNKKEIKELKETIKIEENKLIKLKEKNKNDVQKYMNKIIDLQNKLYNSPQGDIAALEEAIKIDECQILNLVDTINRKKEENEVERRKMFALINREILPLQKELKSEIADVQQLKQELMQWENKTPPEDILKKIQVVMRYIKNCK